MTNTLNLSKLKEKSKYLQMENKDQIKEVQIDKINSSYKNENFQDDITSSKQKSLSSKQSPP
jgi:hypothetical protein